MRFEARRPDFDTCDQQMHRLTCAFKPADQRLSFALWTSYTHNSYKRLLFKLVSMAGQARFSLT